MKKKVTEKSTNRGSKSLWDKLDIPSRFDDIEQWCRDGVIEKDICVKLGVGVTCFNQWKQDHIEICEVLKRGKEVVDQVVVSKLYQRAIGFIYDEIKKETLNDAEGNELKVFRITTTSKYVHPDPTSMIFWLKNRKPDEWRDRHELEHSGSIANTVVLNRVTNFLTLIKESDQKAYEAFVKVTTDNGVMVKPKQISKGKRNEGQKEAS